VWRLAHLYFFVIESIFEVPLKKRKNKKGKKISVKKEK
jgi:hypothetical protein